MIQQKFKPNKDKLKLNNVSVSVKGLRPEADSIVQTGVTNVPTVYYYGFNLEPKNIKKMIIDTNKFMPMCYISYIDNIGILHDIGFPADNAKLTIVMPSNHPTLANVFMDFKIQKYEVEVTRQPGVRKIHFWGICNVDNLLISEYKSYDDTSFNVMSQFAQDAGLGYVSNIDSSNDKMKWLNPSFQGYEFLQDVSKKSWVGEGGFIWSFVDLFYNLNYIDVEKALSQDIKDIKWVNASVFENNKLVKGKSDTITIPFLTNEPSMRGNNSYFTAEKILNQSTDISLKRGYLRNVFYYDVDGNWSKKGGSYNIYGLDTITSKGTNNNAIYLKGDPGSTEFYTKNLSVHYLDKIDTSNAFPDFLWAKMQNQENVLDLQKIPLQIFLPTPNYNIRRFEKVKLLFVNSNVGVANNASNTKLNGEWMVTGYTLEWNGNSFGQKVNLVKRELTINDI
jgi:hypothetical protein